MTGIPEREIFDTDPAARAAWLDRRRQRHRHSARQACRASSGSPACSRRLETPVDFEALDDQPVDLVFLLLAPEGAGADHLKALSRIARVLRDGETVAKMRGTRDAAAIHALLSDTPGLEGRLTPDRCFRRNPKGRQKPPFAVQFSGC